MTIPPRISDSEDETGGHKTRKQLLAELAGLRGIFDMLAGIPLPMLILNDDQRIVFANAGAERLIDTGREALHGKRLWDVYPKGKDTLFYNMYAKVTASRHPASFVEKHARSGKWFEVFLSPVAGGMVALFQDITARRHKDELPRLALVLLHHMKENVFLMRADGRVFHVNDETRHALGYSTDELVRMSIFDLVPQANLRQWHDILDHIRQHGSTVFESRLRAKGGREYPVEVYANYIALYGQDYYTISARDITERKIADEKINDARTRAEIYLDLMGHDIKNQTMIATGNIEMSLEALEGAGKLDPASKAGLENSLRSLENTVTLINNVQKLQLAISGAASLQRTDVCAVLENVVGEFTASGNRDMYIDFRKCPACAVNADELLKDVFVNLIGNAIKHSSPDRHLVIDVALDIVEEDGKRHCRVAITDNGPGIPDWIKTRLFQRFARGKTDVHGSGLGLYLVRTLLGQYGGSIHVEDRVPGDYSKGAKFIVTIPAAEPN